MKRKRVCGLCLLFVLASCNFGKGNLEEILGFPLEDVDVPISYSYSKFHSSVRALKKEKLSIFDAHYYTIEEDKLSEIMQDDNKDYEIQVQFYNNNERVGCIYVYESTLYYQNQKENLNYKANKKINIEKIRKELGDYITTSFSENETFTKEKWKNGTKEERANILDSFVHQYDLYKMNKIDILSLLDEPDQRRIENQISIDGTCSKIEFFFYQLEGKYASFMVAFHEDGSVSHYSINYV